MVWAKGCSPCFCRHSLLFESAAMRTFRAASLVANLIAICAVPLHGAEQWNQFLGPHGNGHSAATGLPTTWSEDSNVRWKTPIHGKAWSSPVAWGDQIWLTTATENGTRMSAICVNRNTGKIVHDLLLIENEAPDFCHTFNSYASPTPFLEEGRAYVHFGKYGTICLDTATGKKIWERRDFKCNHHRGPGSSPIVFDDLLLVAYDGFDVQYIAAVDKNTGKTVWTRDRKIDYGKNNNDGDWKKAYSTVGVTMVGDTPVAISPSAAATIAYSLRTGDEVWRCRHGGMNASGRPIFGHGLAIFDTHTAGLGTLALRYDGKGDITDTHIAWSYQKSGRQLPNPLLIDGLLYLANDRGVMTCLNATSGKIAWQKRIGGNYVASPLYADGHIYLFGTEGKGVVIKPGLEYHEVADNALDNGCMGSPAVVGKSLIVRTRSHLYCLEVDTASADKN